VVPPATHSEFKGSAFQTTLELDPSAKPSTLLVEKVMHHGAVDASHDGGTAKMLSSRQAARIKTPE